MNQTTRRAATKQSLLGLAVVAVGMIVLACGPGPTPVTTTTASTTTTSTSSTSSTTTIPGCSGYTPTGLVLSDNPAAPGDTITVSGNGPANLSVGIKLVKVVGGTTIDAGTAPVAANGTWAKAVSLPPTMAPGQWSVQATTVGCATAASTNLDIA